MSALFADTRDVSPLAVLRFRSGTRQPEANSAWIELVGPLPPHWLSLFLEEDRAAAGSLLDQPGNRAELRIRPAGAPATSRLALQAVPDADGMSLWAIPIPPGPSDVLGETLERERALGEMRMRFLSLVSHEFRTPLTVILSSSELLEHYGEAWTPEKRRSHFLRLQNAVTTMTSLLDNVSFLGRAESGRIENAPDALALQRLLGAAIDDLAGLRSPDQEVRLALSPADATATLDPRILRAVVSNLLSNALRFSPSFQDVTISVTVTSKAMEIAVDDQGGGIPPSEADRIWEPFERGSNSTGIPGSGLGLAIVRRCMELVGGTAVHLPNPAGRGTRALVRFPLGEEAP